MRRTPLTTTPRRQPNINIVWRPGSARTRWGGSLQRSPLCPLTAFKVATGNEREAKYIYGQRSWPYIYFEGRESRKEIKVAGREGSSHTASSWILHCTAYKASLVPLTKLYHRLKQIDWNQMNWSAEETFRSNYSLRRESGCPRSGDTANSVS